MSIQPGTPTTAAPSVAPKKPQPVLYVQSTLAFLAFVFGGLTAACANTNNHDLILLSGLGTLLTGGANAAMGVFLKGQVVPINDVAAYVGEDRTTVIAGPAAPVEDGTPVATTPIPPTMPATPMPPAAADTAPVEATPVVTPETAAGNQGELPNPPA